MSIAYRAVQWNRHKKVYDGLLAGGVLAFLGTFVAVGKLVWTGANSVSDAVLVIRATGACAFAMLHVVLCVGPLARLWPNAFAPLLYNRRHFGVTLFLVGFTHALLNIGYYHGFGRLNPLVSVLVSNRNLGSLAAFPFEWLGIAALVILFLMAATSHDFWLKNLTPPVWKTLHMLVYVAYGLLVLHVVLGALQSEPNAAYPVLLAIGFVTIVLLHLIAGMRENRRDQGRSDEQISQPGAAVPHSGATALQWIDVGDVREIPESRAKVVCLPGRERVAIFRHEGRLSALSNVCAHQNGPLGEGKIVGGCVTCPWHGYQYLAENGQSPPPFTEKVPTFRVRVEGTRILLDPTPLPPGTPVEPARFEERVQ